MVTAKLHCLVESRTILFPRSRRGTYNTDVYKNTFGMEPVGKI